MDLLGSILGTMQKPPTMGDEERKKAKGSLIFSVDVSRVVRICSIIQLMIMKIYTLKCFKFCLQQRFNNILVCFFFMNCSTKGLT